jgi:dihydrofolate reductase
VKIIQIVAKATNNVIGKDNLLVWKLSSDMQRFKNLTSGHHILMGRKTFESLGKPLPNRTHLIITRNPDFKALSGHHAFTSVDEAIIFCQKINLEQLFIIGGGQIYHETINICNQLEITEVDVSPEGDTFYPEIERKIWKEINRQSFPADEKNEYNYSFVTYSKVGESIPFDQ